MSDTKPIQILINGADRTSSIPVESIRYSDTINNEARTVDFQVLDGASFGLATGQTVVIADANDATAKIFSGVIASLEPDPEGAQVDYAVSAIDDVFWLEGGEALVGGAYDSMTDAAIIADFMATTNSYIDATTNVVAVATITHIEFDNETPRQALEKLAEIANARWFVDDNSKLHYFAADWQMPITLTDDIAAASESAARLGTFRFGTARLVQGEQTYMFYGNFKKTEEVPAATKVIVYGAQDAALATVTGTAINGRHRTTKLVNRDIQDASQATTHGQRLLDELNAPAISLSVYEPWLRAGWSVKVVNSLTGVDGYFIINEVNHVFLGGGYLRSDLQLGRYLAPLPKIIADVQRTVSGSSKAGARGGGAGGGGVPALGHGHSGGADGSQIGAGGLNVTHTVTGSTGGANEGTINVASASHPHTGSLSGYSDYEILGTINVAGWKHIHAVNSHYHTVTVSQRNVPSQSHYHVVNSHAHNVLWSRKLFQDLVNGDYVVTALGSGTQTATSEAASPNTGVDAGPDVAVLVPYDVQLTQYARASDSKSPNVGIPSGIGTGTPDVNSYEAVVNDTQHRHGLTAGVVTINANTSTQAVDAAGHTHSPGTLAVAHV